MTTQQLLKSAAAALCLFGAVGAHATGLDDVGSFGTNAYVNGSNGYTFGRNMQYNGGATFKAFCIDPGTGYTDLQTYSTTSLNSFFNGTNSSGYAQQISRGGSINGSNVVTGSGVSGYYAGLSTSAAMQTQIKNDLNDLFSWAYADAISTTTGSTAKVAAFGIAVWEIMTQNGGLTGTTFSKTVGTVKSTGADGTSGNGALAGDSVEYWLDKYLSALNSSAANAWTTAIGVSAATTWNYTIYYDTSNPYNQNFITVTHGVPEPATLALAGLGILGAVRFSRRNKKQA